MALNARGVIQGPLRQVLRWHILFAHLSSKSRTTSQYVILTHTSDLFCLHILR